MLSCVFPLLLQKIPEGMISIRIAGRIFGRFRYTRRTAGLCHTGIHPAAVHCAGSADLSAVSGHRRQRSETPDNSAGDRLPERRFFDGGYGNNQHFLKQEMPPVLYFSCTQEAFLLLLTVSL